MLWRYIMPALIGAAAATMVFALWLAVWRHLHDDCRVDPFGSLCKPEVYERSA